MSGIRNPTSFVIEPAFFKKGAASYGNYNSSVVKQNRGCQRGRVSVHVGPPCAFLTFSLWKVV